MGNRQDTIKKIIISAKKLFWENGYKKITMQQIADASGITKGLLTHYFPKKSDLLATINYQNFMKIHKILGKYAENEPLLQYMLTTYLLRKSQYSLPQLQRISEEAFLTQQANSISDYITHDSIFIDILKQFNINLSLTDLHPKLIMGMGAQKELSHVYLHNIIDMDMEEFLRNTVMIMCTVLEIPAIIRNDYYSRMQEILRHEELPSFSYLDGDEQP